VAARRRLGEAHDRAGQRAAGRKPLDAADEAGRVFGRLDRDLEVADPLDEVEDADAGLRRRRPLGDARDERAAPVLREAEVGLAVGVERRQIDAEPSLHRRRRRIPSYLRERGGREDGGHRVGQPDHERVRLFHRAAFDDEPEESARGGKGHRAEPLAAEVLGGVEPLRTAGDGLDPGVLAARRVAERASVAAEEEDLVADPRCGPVRGHGRGSLAGEHAEEGALGLLVGAHEFRLALAAVGRDRDDLEDLGIPRKLEEEARGEEHAFRAERQGGREEGFLRLDGARLPASDADGPDAAGGVLRRGGGREKEGGERDARPHSSSSPGSGSTLSSSSSAS